MDMFEEYRASLAYACILRTKLAELPGHGNLEFEAYVPGGYNLRTCTEKDGVRLEGPHEKGKTNPEVLLDKEPPADPILTLLADGLHTLVFRMSCRYQQLLKRV